MYFPRFSGEISEDERAEDIETDRGDGETVLVVDDEPAIRMVITEVLSEVGYRVIEAEDGPSGLRILQAGGRIDLLITDVGLPGGLNGRQVADAARAIRTDLKVLFITGFAENALIGNGHLDAGMSVITKPFVNTALANKVRQLIDT
jgi:CheY-like chemotaxis protein